MALGCRGVTATARLEIIIGIGMSMKSGTDVSILYDSLKEETGDRSKYTGAMANLQLSMTTSESIAAVIGGLLASISYKHCLMLEAVMGWGPLASSL